MDLKNLFEKAKAFIIAHKTASIITASVLGLGVIGGTTAGIVYAVNNNDSEVESEAPTVNTTQLVANQLEGQEINPVDLQDVTEEVQADGTTVIKDKNGTVVAKKDASGKTTLTQEGASAIASGNIVTTGSLANTVADTNNYVASIPQENTYIASNDVIPSTPASTPSYSAPVSQGCNHNWVDDYTTVHHDAVDNSWDEEIREPVEYYKCDHCDYEVLRGEGIPSEGDGKMVEHFTTTHSELGRCTYTSKTKMVVTQTIHHENITPAYDEKVYAGSHCSICGARR